MCLPFSTFRSGKRTEATIAALRLQIEQLHRRAGPNPLGKYKLISTALQ